MLTRFCTVLAVVLALAAPAYALDEKDDIIVDAEGLCLAAFRLCVKTCRLTVTGPIGRTFCEGDCDDAYHACTPDEAAGTRPKDQINIPEKGVFDPGAGSPSNDPDQTEGGGGLILMME